jgi:hypothetical protein
VSDTEQWKERKCACKVQRGSQWWRRLSQPNSHIRLYLARYMNVLFRLFYNAAVVIQLNWHCNEWGVSAYAKIDVIPRHVPAATDKNHVQRRKIIPGTSKRNFFPKGNITFVRWWLLSVCSPISKFWTNLPTSLQFDVYCRKFHRRSTGHHTSVAYIRPRTSTRKTTELLKYSLVKQY